MKIHWPGHWPSKSQVLSALSVIVSLCAFINNHWQEISGVPGVPIPPQVRSYAILAGLLIPAFCRALTPSLAGRRPEHKGKPARKTTAAEKPTGVEKEKDNVDDQS